MKRLIAVLSVLALATGAEAATTNYPITDSTGTQRPIAAEQSGGTYTPHSQPEIGGAPVSSSNPMPVTSSVTASALTNSTAGTMGTTAAIIVPFSATRKWLMVTSRTAGSETQDIGSASVTVGGGIPLQPGGGFLFTGVGAAGPLYGITTVAGSAFSFVEG